MIINKLKCTMNFCYSGKDHQFTILTALFSLVIIIIISRYNTCEPYHHNYTLCIIMVNHDNYVMSTNNEITGKC